VSMICGVAGNRRSGESRILEHFLTSPWPHEPRGQHGIRAAAGPSPDRARHRDWDFWIQLAQRTRFAFTARATNRWSAHSGESGCGMGSNSDPARQDHFGGRLVRKWSSLSAQLHCKLRHHRLLGERALRKEMPEEARRHFAAAEAILCGSPAKVRALRAMTRERRQGLTATGMRR
jgi:hypothetical protein